MYVSILLSWNISLNQKLLIFVYYPYSLKLEIQIDAKKISLIMPKTFNNLQKLIEIISIAMNFDINKIIFGISFFFSFTQ